MSEDIRTYTASDTQQDIADLSRRLLELSRSQDERIERQTAWLEDTRRLQQQIEAELRSESEEQRELQQSFDSVTSGDWQDEPKPAAPEGAAPSQQHRLGGTHRAATHKNREGVPKSPSSIIWSLTLRS
ncbi:hypothetical protein Emed_007662 [Eimeria media]